MIVGVIYHPPDTSPSTFNSNLDELLMLINSTNNDCILLGDYNIDISREDSNKNDLITTLHSPAFFPTIKLSTRITHSSRTIIENITNIQYCSST